MRYSAIVLGAFATLLPAAATAQDQAVPRAQFITTMDGEFRKMDKDKNGQVTRAEADAYQRAAAVALATTRARASFATLDRDKNGQLSFDEFFKLVSADRITADGQRFIATMDNSRDGQISLIEHRTATLTNFDRIDADKDGIVSPVEMKTGGIR